ncbi:MAG: OB-fold nucleic acid binding domain-containing protein, partial [Calditrichia bacterium]
YGIIVYQEQVMRIASELGGFSLGKADILRRAMGKKKEDVMARMRVKFIDGCRKNGIPEKTAEAIFELIFRFAKYGFNKSHSAAYSLLAYQTAYLKKHFPAEFMAANMTTEITNSSRIVVLIEECRRMGLKILSPDVNVSGVLFEVPEPDTISFGMAAIKNVGQAAIRAIIKAREESGPFKNIYYLMQSVDLRALNKKVLEALVQAGAMDHLEGSRAQNFAAIEPAISFAQKYQNQAQNKSQISMFELLNNNGGEKGPGEFVTYPPLPDVPDWPVQEMLDREKELLGFYISGHPLDKYAQEIHWFGTLNWDDPESYREGREVQTAAIISEKKPHMDRKGNIMAFLTLEDRRNSFEAIVFSSVYEKYQDHIEKGEMVWIRGNVDKSGEQTFKMICNEILPLGQVRNRLSNAVHLIVDVKHISEGELKDLRSLLENNPGTIPLFIDMRPNGNGTRFLLRSRIHGVSLDDDFLRKVYSIIGRDNVKIRTG